MSGTITGLLRMKGLLPAALASRAGLAAIGAALLVAACSESPAPPLAPSSLPGDKVQELLLTCAADVSRRSSTGAPVRVQYGSPAVLGGLEPVTTTCAPAAGSRFPVGRSRVTCTGQDALQQTALCSLFVTVLPTLSVSKILAFGDSFTAGTTATPVPTIVFFDPGNSYPAQLQVMLDQRYTAQSIRVVNSGLGGELAINAGGRFLGQLALEQPDVVLIMEGTNDLLKLDFTTSAPAASAIERMVVDAKIRGVDPILATVPPMRAVLAEASRVAPYNDLLRQIAARQGVPLVDVHQLLRSGQCSGEALVCIGDDHFHPTSSGYVAIATGFFGRLMSIYEGAGSGGAGVLSQTQIQGETHPLLIDSPLSPVELR